MNGNNGKNAEFDIFFNQVVNCLFENLGELKKLANYEETNTDPNYGFGLFLPEFKLALFQGVNPKGRLVFSVESLRGSFKIFTVSRDGFLEYDTIEKFGNELTKKIIIFLAGGLIHEITWEKA